MLKIILNRPRLPQFRQLSKVVIIIVRAKAGNQSSSKLPPINTFSPIRKNFKPNLSMILRFNAAMITLSSTSIYETWKAARSTWLYPHRSSIPPVPSLFWWIHKDKDRRNLPAIETLVWTWPVQTLGSSMADCLHKADTNVSKFYSIQECPPLPSLHSFFAKFIWMKVNTRSNPHYLH